MAYVVRQMQAAAKGDTTGQEFVISQTVIYATTAAAALAQGAEKLKVSEDQLTVDLLEDDMSDELADRAQELYPGQTLDGGMVANVTDEMRGAAQTKVYGSGTPA